MIALVQRVTHAHVIDKQNEATIGEIGPGLLVFLGVARTDTLDQSKWLAKKIEHLRIFNDAEGKMNRSVLDMGFSVLVVSQFTLCGSVRHGNRPGFDRAARPEKAGQLYDDFIQRLKQDRLTVATGRFAADMAIHLVNDGPVTIWIETPGDDHG
jgi:D-aminoacyl-tRNA deacylase